MGPFLRVTVGLVLTACVLSLPTTPTEVIHAHVIAHTHDDPGWLKNVDEYYYGARNDIQRAGVQYILDSVVECLEENPMRKFIYVEMSFFWRWWGEQTEAKKEAVRVLVREGRLQFINGGWVMHDEAATFYPTMIDQMTDGHLFLLKEFGIRPTTTWHIDPFGHSSGTAAMFADMAMDGFFFARIDYEDRDIRRQNRTMEMIWRGDVAMGKSSDIFTSVLYDHYGPPSGFCFDDLCDDTPVEADKRMQQVTGNNLKDLAEKFAEACKQYSTGYRTNQVLIPFGSDFQFQNANMDFKNMDKIIKYLDEHPELGVKAFYSSPSDYAVAVNKQKPDLPLKKDDFFPYRDNPYASWTGYFTSRPVFKGLSRFGNAVLQTVQRFTTVEDPAVAQKAEPTGMAALRRAVGLAQHHDAITGTEKTAVVDDYAERIFIGLKEVAARVHNSVASLLGAEVSPEEDVEVAIGGALPNHTDTLYYRTALGKEVEFSLVNSLAWERAEVFTVNVSVPGLKVHGPDGAAIPSQVVKACPFGRMPGYLLSFVAKVPAMGAARYSIVPSAGVNELEWARLPAHGVSFRNDEFTAAFNGEGRLKAVTSHADDVSLDIEHDMAWYLSSGGNDVSSQASGAYIFRSNGTAKPFHDEISSFYVEGPISSHVTSMFEGPEARRSMRYSVNDRADALEVAFHINDINITDVTGREVISRFTTPIPTDGKLYTDTNGMHTLERIRNFRESWKVNITDPISDNYYPVDTRISIKCPKNRVVAGVVTDRAHGGASLKDGQFEVMLHRRMSIDDGRGVGEALNETGWLGDLFLRQLIVVAAPQTAAVAMKTGQNTLNYPLLPVLGKMNGGSGMGSPLRRALPANVELLSFNSMFDTGEVIIRLHHIYEPGEHDIYSKPAQVDLADMFDGWTVAELRETTLNANLDLSATKPMEWSYSGTNDVPTPKVLKGTVATLEPMQFRTFVVRLEKR